jgi:hypothetical protein
MKMTIIRRHSVRLPHIEKSANEYHNRSQADACAQHPADGDFHFQIGF